MASQPLANWSLGAPTKSYLKLGIQLYSLRGFKVEEALQHAKSVGFEQVEFYSGMFALNSTKEQIEEMVGKLSRLA